MYIFDNNIVGLVLAGGGGKGAYQVGVLKALEEKGLLTDVEAISGASIGSINAILYNMGGVALMEKAWADIKMETVFAVDADSVRGGQVSFSRNEMQRLMDKYIDYVRLSNSDPEVICSVCRTEEDAFYSEYMTLNGQNQEGISNILMASTSLPVIYAPVMINGKRYRDGGIKDNEPIKPLYDMGIRKFIVIGLTSSKVFDGSMFPDAEFKVIYPSHDLGSLFSGTLNFSEYAKEVRLALGYKDGLRAIKTKFECDPDYIRNERQLAVQDYTTILSEIDTKYRYKQMTDSTNDNIRKFNDIARRFDDF